MSTVVNPLQPARELYPHREPYLTGTLDVGDGQALAWEESGNPDGKPVVFLHGGPGGGCGPMPRRFFDPERYRVILFDQRGCGNSRPHASEPDADLSTNTTWHLVDDAEKVRIDRGIDRWQVFGGSWGSALALAYAETHPDRVTEMVLRGVFTLRRWELDWFYNGPAGIMQPEWWDVFLGPLRSGPYVDRLDGVTPGHDNIARYHDLLWDPDPAIHGPAGIAWSQWEAATANLIIRPEHVTDFGDPAFALAFARIENHFFVNGGWFRDNQLIDDAVRLRHIPCVIVQGQYDLCCPARTAWDLHQVWPESDLRLVLAGHSAAEPLITSELVSATDQFAE